MVFPTPPSQWSFLFYETRARTLTLTAAFSWKKSRSAFSECGILPRQEGLFGTIQAARIGQDYDDDEASFSLASTSAGTKWESE